MLDFVRVRLCESRNEKVAVAIATAVIAMVVEVTVIITEIVMFK